MKKRYFFVLMISLTSCYQPRELLEAGQPEKAIDVCINRLTNANKVKLDYLFVIEEAQTVLLSQDTQWLNAIHARNQPSNWPKIYRYLEEVASRQEKIIKMDKQLERKGYPTAIRYLNTSDLLDEARENSAIYYYAAAQEDLPAALSGDRQAARRAWYNIRSCREYLPDFRDSPQLEETAYTLGVTNVDVHFIAGELDTDFLEEYLGDLLRSVSFPMKKDWIIYHFNEEEAPPADYTLEVVFKRYRISPNNENSSCCISKEEVEVGVEITKEWSDRDSAYVEVEEPIYEEVRATATTITQEKDAYIRAQLLLIDNKRNEIAFEDDLTGRETWTNEFTIVSGDSRAEGEDFCPDGGGMWSSYPSRHSMLVGSMRSMGWSLKRKIKRKLPIE